MFARRRFHSEKTRDKKTWVVGKCSIFFVHTFRLIADCRCGRERNNNLANSAVTGGTFRSGINHRVENKNPERPLPVSWPVEGLTLFYGKVSPGGDVFSRMEYKLQVTCL